MKKLFFAMLTCLFMLMISASATDITVDDVKVVFTDAEPLVQNGRTLTPLRAVAEAMHADVTWREADKTIVLSKNVSNVPYNGMTYDNATFVAEMQVGRFTLYLKLLHNGAEVYNVKKEMDARPQVINNRTYVPARYMGYALGYDTDWVNETVCYRDTRTQNTWFTLDRSVKFPLVGDKWKCRYYQGYGSIKVADADAGTRTYITTNWYGKPLYQYSEDFVQYPDSGGFIYDTERFNIDLSNPIATMKNVQTVWEDVATGLESRTEWVEGDTSPWTRLTFHHHGVEGREGTTVALYYYPPTMSDYQWRIFCHQMPTDFSQYMYPNAAGTYVPGYKNITTDDRYGARDSALMLHTFLGETGERIWQMMYDYYTVSGYHALNGTKYVDADFVTPEIDPSIAAMYGLSVKSSVKNSDYNIAWGGFTMELNDEVNGKTIKINYVAMSVNDDNYYGDTRNPRFDVYF